jgi:hypothetical protein
MQLPEALVLQNYRGYADEQWLSLRPITLLFGRNNAGKSALARALPLLANSIRKPGRNALDISGPVVNGASFDELRWRGPADDTGRRELMMGLRWPDALEVRFAFDWPDRRNVRVHELRVGADGAAWWLADPRVETANSGTLMHFRLGGRGESALAVTFDGLDPVEITGDLPAGLRDAAERLREFGGQVQWLAAVRRPKGRLTDSTELRGQSQFAPDARDVIAWLWEHPEITAAVSDWYKTHLNSSFEVRERRTPGYTGYEPLLSHLGNPEVIVNLLDTGEGNVQVLPVLAALAAAERDEGPSIVVIEEPESHLHPHLQAALARRIGAVAKGRADHVRIVLETHSEHVLLTVQKLILEGLPPEQVALYWVEQLADARTVARRVEIGADGTFGPGWPPGVFDDSLSLAEEIMRLQTRGLVKE